MLPAPKFIRIEVVFQDMLGNHILEKVSKTVEQYAVISAGIGIILCYGKSYV